MRKILVISYTFPPSGGVGSPVALAFLRHLPATGNQVWVLTPRNPATPVQDPELARLIPPDAHDRVIRTWTPEVPYRWRDKVWKRFDPPHRVGKREDEQNSERLKSRVKSAARARLQGLLFPDPQVVWTRSAVRRASKLISQVGIDSLFFNAPPFSILKIAVELKTRFPRLNVYTHLRDDWVGYYMGRFDSPSEEKMRRTREMERAAVEASTMVSIASPVWAQGLRERYPEEPQQKFFCMTNGYEPESFAGFPTAYRKGDELKVNYFGTVYQNPIYSPQPFFEAVEALPATTYARVQARFMGRVQDEAMPLFQNRKMDVKTLGFMPKLKGIQMLKDADLLLVIANGPESHAGKLFDYLATGKPILALTHPEGAMARLIRETGAGWAVDAEDREGIQRVIMECIAAVAAGRPLTQPNWDEIRKYSWPEIVSQWARITDGKVSAQQLAKASLDG
ncbi:MAG: hypothetical protein NVS9B15_18770 [Acidobacteriaceae bacterium]